MLQDLKLQETTATVRLDLNYFVRTEKSNVSIF